MGSVVRLSPSLSLLSLSLAHPSSVLCRPLWSGYYMATLEAALQHILDLADDLCSSTPL
jgi:hypothetical protein